MLDLVRVCGWVAVIGAIMMVASAIWVCTHGDVNKDNAEALGIPKAWAQLTGGATAAWILIPLLNHLR